MHWLAMRGPCPLRSVMHASCGQLTLWARHCKHAPNGFVGGVDVGVADMVENQKMFLPRRGGLTHPWMMKRLETLLTLPDGSHPNPPASSTRTFQSVASLVDGESGEQGYGTHGDAATCRDERDRRREDVVTTEDDSPDEHSLEASGFRSYVLRDVDHRGIMGSGQRSDLESFTLSGQWGCRNGWG
jgi:hypothetical protein